MALRQLGWCVMRAPRPSLTPSESCSFLHQEPSHTYLASTSLQSSSSCSNGLIGGG